MKNPLEGNPIVLIGGANLDIVGRSRTTIIPRDSNPGTVRFSIGGVGRNIAENLARLGVPVELVCGLGPGPEAVMIENHCREAGLGMNHCIRAGGNATSAYLALSDEQGDMAWAVSDMSAADALVPEALEPIRPLLESAPLVIADTNIPADSLTWLSGACGNTPLYIDPVSTTKALKISDILSSVHTLKLNLIEARSLVPEGSAVSSDVGDPPAEAALLARMLRKSGVSRVVITFGGGRVFWDGDRYQGFYEHETVPMIDATGAGDAFFAGLIYADLLGSLPEQAMKTAAAAATSAVLSESPVNPRLSRNMLEEILHGRI